MTSSNQIKICKSDKKGFTPLETLRAKKNHPQNKSLTGFIPQPSFLLSKIKTKVKVIEKRKIWWEGNRKKKNLVCGFTLVEIIIVVFITSIIIGMVVFRYQNFSDSIELENMSLDVVLSVREAQVFGISSRGTTTMESFFYAYGVCFSLTDPTSYISFIDSDEDNLWYDPFNENMRTTTFAQGYSINDICVITPPSALWDCTTPTVNILFQRPDVNAIIKTEKGSDLSSSARIELISPSGATTSVNISESGQAYID